MRLLNGLLGFLVFVSIHCYFAFADAPNVLFPKVAIELISPATFAETFPGITPVLGTIWDNKIFFSKQDSHGICHGKGLYYLDLIDPQISNPLPSLPVDLCIREISADEGGIILILFNEGHFHKTRFDGNQLTPLASHQSHLPQWAWQEDLQNDLHRIDINKLNWANHSVVNETQYGVTYHKDENAERWMETHLPLGFSLQPMRYQELPFKNLFFSFLSPSRHYFVGSPNPKEVNAIYVSDITASKEPKAFGVNVLGTKILAATGASNGILFISEFPVEEGVTPLDGRFRLGFLGDDGELFWSNSVHEQILKSATGLHVAREGILITHSNIAPFIWLGNGLPFESQTFFSSAYEDISRSEWHSLLEQLKVKPKE